MYNYHYHPFLVYGFYDYHYITFHLKIFERKQRSFIRIVFQTELTIVLIYTQIIIFKFT